jgi:hypothetical protein
MDGTDSMPTTAVSGSEVGNDLIANIKPEIRDDFYYFQNLIFKGHVVFNASNSIILN